MENLFNLLKDNGFMPAGTGADNPATSIIENNDDLMIECNQGILNPDFLEQKFGYKSVSDCVVKLLGDNGIPSKIDPRNNRFVVLFKQ